jgi:hypothetical protein
MRRGTVFFVLAALALASFYFTGHLDRLLYPVGLNFKECGRNGLGATFCGTELDEYRARIQGVQTKLREAQQQSQEAFARIKREGEARTP